MKRILILCLALTSTGAYSQEQAAAPDARAASKPQTAVTALAAKAQQAYEEEQYQEYLAYLQRIRKRQPYNGKVMYKLAEAYALTDQPEQAFTTLVLMLQQGLALNPEGDEDFANINQYQLFDFLVKHFRQNSQPFNKADLAFSLDQRGLMPEGIAYSDAQEAFYIGSVRQGSVWQVTAGGEAELFIDQGAGGLSGVFDLAVDSERGVLWIASNMVPQYSRFQESDGGEAALFRFDLESGDFEARYPVGGDKLDHVLTNIAVAPDGAVYVSDSLSPLIYYWQSGNEKLKPFIGSSHMTSLQGLAISPDGKYLFVTDYVKGLFRIQLDNRQVVRVGHERNINLGGIHDIVFYDQSLIAIQNGIQPPRVVKYKLSKDLAAVVGQQPLSANQPQYDELGQGVRVGDAMYFIANTQRSQYGGGGKVSDESALEPVKVLKADLDLGEKLPHRPIPDSIDTRIPEKAPGDAASKESNATDPADVSKEP